MLQKDKTGLIGEIIATKFLIHKKYEILYKRYSLPRWGEIDIIAKKDETIYFVEVKTSKSNFDPLDAINYHKLQHLQRSIDYFFCEKGSKYVNYHRILKVIGIKLSKDNKLLSLNEFNLE